MLEEEEEVEGVRKARKELGKKLRKLKKRMSRRQNKIKRTRGRIVKAHRYQSSKVKRMEEAHHDLEEQE